MRIGSILILMIVAMGILVIPAAADTGYGPDHYTLQKNGTLDLSTATNGYLNQDMIIESYTPTADLVRSVLIINCTLKKYPVQFSLPSVISIAPTKPWSALPPALEARFVFKESGTTHIMANLTITAYKQIEPYVNYYGYFTYVNIPYLNTKTGNVQSDLPTVIYDNITNGGASPNLKPVFAGDTVNLTKITDIAGFYWASTGAASTPPQLWVDPTGGYYTVYSLNSKIEYGVTNNPSNYDKVIMINRPNMEQSNLQIYQNSTLQYESESTTISESHLIFPSTHGIFKIWVNATALNYTIFDDNISSYTPPPPPGPTTWDLIVIVRDASTSGLYDGATVTKTDLTDPYYNGWGTTYSGRVTFQAITGHEYNFSASAVGYTTGYANYSAITPINPYVSIWIYPIGTPATGYGYLDFMVRDSVGNTLEQAQVHLTDGQTKYTLMGYTRFNVTASTVIGYSVMKENYNTVTGNITSTTGTLTIPIILYNTGEGPTPTPTLDRRTSQQKFIDAGAVFANNAELFASLIVMAVMISLIDKITLGSLSRAFGGRRKGK